MRDDELDAIGRLERQYRRRQIVSGLRFFSVFLLASAAAKLWPWPPATDTLVTRLGMGGVVLGTSLNVAAFVIARRNR
jgi:hypothetical protein